MESPVVSTLTLSEDGKTLAVAHGKSGATGEIVTYLLGKDNTSATPIFQLKAHNDLIQSLSFSPDGKLLASCSYDRLVKIWSIPEGKLIQELKDHSDSDISSSDISDSDDSDNSSKDSFYYCSDSD
jgi:WD40 repeat protein